MRKRPKERSQYPDTKFRLRFKNLRCFAAQWDGAFGLHETFKFPLVFCKCSCRVARVVRNQTIIEWLEITSEEERELKTIISDEERRRRDRERDEKRRREAGAMTRDEYEGRARDRRREALEMRERGFSRSRIAAEMGVSLSTVKRALRQGGSSPSG